MNRPSLVAAVMVALITSAPALADTAAAPIRHLVYSFTYSAQQNTAARDATTIASGSGISHYNGNLTDKGTIIVDVMREQPDRGLVVVVSEQGEETRKASPATCVVYGNTNVICDPNETVNPEEYTLLRFMGPTFIDPNQLDAKSHWLIDTGNDATHLTADYTIEHNDNGVMTIGEVRSIKVRTPQIMTTNVQTTIGYDFSRLLPTAVDEYTTQRQDAGMHGTSTTTFQTTLKLVSDSMAKGG